MSHSIRKPVFVILVFLLASLACSLSGNQETMQQPTPTPLPPTAVPTLVPTRVPSPVPTTSGRMVTFENVGFVVPNGLSLFEQGHIVPPMLNGLPLDVTVQHTAFSFTGYPLAGTSKQPAIYVFPTEGFDMAVEPIATMNNMLALLPADSNPMPFLPPVNAIQMFHSKVEYLGFGSGSGVRYLTQEGQGIWPVNNQDVFYTFQGLTSDGKYYLSVIMPISNSALPASGDGADLEQLANDYPGYLSVVRAQLDGLPDDSFAPTLAALDTLVQSIVIK